MSKKYYSTKEVSEIIGVRKEEIYRWFRFYNSDEYTKPDDLKLPKVKRSGVYPETARYLFTEQDIKQLQEFRKLITGKYRGLMGEYNYRFRRSRKQRSRITKYRK